MRISFVFLLSLLLGVAGFAQSNPVGSNFKADSAKLAQETKLAEMKIQHLRTIRNLDQAYRESAAQAGLDTTRRKVEETRTVTIGTVYTACESPKPWFQIPNRPTWRALGGFQLGYGYPIGYHAAVGVGVRCQVLNHWSFSTVVKGNQIVANDSMGSWLHRTKTAASIRGSIEYVGLFPNEPAKYCWQVSGYFEKYFFPGTINWSHALTKDPLTAPVVVNLKHSLRLPDQRMGIQGKICFDAFNLGAFAEFYPRLEAVRDGQRLRYGGGLFVGFGL